MWMYKGTGDSYIGECIKAPGPLGLIPLRPSASIDFRRLMY